MSAIHADAPNTDTSLDSMDEVSNAFMDLWKDDANEPSSDEDEEDTSEDTTEEPEADEETADEQDESEGSEDEDGDESDEDTSDDDDDDAEDDEQPPKALADDAVVKIKVDGQELDVPVADLKRLYGQEAALTRKSQEVATKRKEAEDKTAAAVAASEALLTRAKERFTPYNDIDWPRALKELSADEFNALRGEAQRAYQDIEFFDKELGGLMEKARNEQTTRLVAEAQASLAELTDPVKGIKGFNQQVYSDMHSFAVAQGVPSELMDNLVSAPVLRLLHKAMLFDRGTKVVTKTQDKRPKKIVKGSVNSGASTKAFNNTTKKPLGPLNSMDDTAAAFMATFRSDDD